MEVECSCVCLQGGMFCYCGNSYGKYGMSEDCGVACLGDDNQLCGGFSSNYVYHVEGSYTCPDVPNPKHVLVVDILVQKNTQRLGTKVLDHS